MKSSRNILNILGALAPQEIEVTYTGEVKMKKNGNPFYEKEGRSFVLKADVTYRKKGKFTFGGNYGEMVNEALAENGKPANFTPEGLKYGKWADGLDGKVIIHNGETYLRVYRTDSPTEVDYIVAGAPATEREIEVILENLQQSSPSAKQSAAGLDEGYQVIPLNINLEKIESITLSDGTRILAEEHPW